MANSTAPDCRIAVLGPVTVSVNGQQAPLRPVEAKIIALLTAKRGETASAEFILDQVWEGSPPEGAKKTLGFHVSHLRRTLREAGAPASPIETVTGGYRLNTEHTEIDAIEFESSVAKASAIVGNAPETALSLAESALALWNGEAYADQFGPDSVESEARRLNEVRVNAREVRARALIWAGKPEQAASDAQQIVEEHPHRESAVALVMLALYRGGRQRDALDFFDRSRKALVEETGLEAGRELSDLAARIARQDVALDPSAGFDSEVTATLRPGTPFVGREVEFAHLQDALDSERLVSVVGSGGVGKTRLVGELLLSLDGDSQRTVYLGPLRSTDAVLVSIAEAFGVSVPTGTASLTAIASQIDRDSTVLFLDNAEHLLDLAREIAGELLAHTQSLKIIVTTRQALGLPSEFVMRLTPLSTESGESRYTPAAQMFAAAARRIDSGFDLDETTTPAVDAITTHLDGLPLAIELAAAQLRRLSLSGLQSAIESDRSILAAPRGTRAARHSTLSAALEWSYRLLPADSQATLRLLAVFRDGASLDAISAVADGNSTAIVEQVLDLVDRSLVNFEAGPGGSRYWLFETTKRHLLELTSDEEHAEHRDRHLRWIADLVSRTVPKLRTRDEANARAALEVEENNVRSAIEWSIQEWPAIGMAIIGELKLYLVAKDHLSAEARAAVRALVLVNADATERTVASFHACAGVLDFLAGDLDHAIPHYQTALAHLEGDDAQPAQFRSRNELSLALIESGRIHDARDLLAVNRTWASRSGELGFLAQVSMLEAQVAAPDEQDAALLAARLESEEAGRISSVAYVTEMRGWLLIQTSDLDLAEREFRRSSDLWSDVGNTGAVNSSLCGIGVAQQLRGDLDNAIATLNEAVELGRASAWSRGHARALNRLAAVQRSAGDVKSAAELLRTAIAIWSELPVQPGLAYARLLDAGLAADDGDTARSVASAERSAEIWSQFHRYDGVAACASQIVAATGPSETLLNAQIAQARAWTTPFVVNGSLFPETSSISRWLADYEMTCSSIGATDDEHRLAVALQSASAASWSNVADAAASFLHQSGTARATARSTVDIRLAGSSP